MRGFVSSLLAFLAAGAASGQDAPSLDALLAELASPDYEKAEEAEIALAERGDEGRLALERYLLVELKYEQEIDRGRLGCLIERLGDDDYAAREKAAAEIAELGPRVLGALEAARGNAMDPEIAGRLELAIARVNGEIWKSLRERALTLAILALVRIGSADSAPLLVRLVGSGDLHLARTADFALRAILMDGPEPSAPGARTSTPREWEAFLGRKREEPRDIFVVPGTASETRSVEAKWGTWREPELGRRPRLEIEALAADIVPQGQYPQEPRNTFGRETVSLEDRIGLMSPFGAELASMEWPIHRLRYFGRDARGRGRFACFAAAKIWSRMEVQWGLERFSCWLAGEVVLEPGTGRLVRCNLAGPAVGETWSPCGLSMDGEHWDIEIGPLVFDQGLWYEAVPGEEE
ncbi:MAG: hypothetical protein HY720_04355 [Planctomycetes bacterium]|nr:hypothetical protein [Planctomycetota bacterium]